MTFETLIKVASLSGILALVLQAVFAWLLWSLRREFMTRRECAKCHAETDDRMGELAQRQAAVEMSMKMFPTRKELGEVRLEMESLRGDNAALRSEIKGLAELLARVEKPVALLVEHHINTGGGR